jgi:transcriptional adapter 3
MAPATIPKSPALYESQNSQASSSLSTLASHADIPSTSDLSQLAISLRERSVLLIRRRKNLKSDESNVLQGRLSSKDSNDDSLTFTLDLLEEQVAADSSPLTTKQSLAVPFGASASRAGQAASPSPRPPQLSASPAPSSTAQGSTSNGPVRTKIKIKRDPDRTERDRSESIIEVGSTPAPESVVGEATESVSRSLGGGEASPTLEADWDDEAPARPGRTYQSKRKRQRTSQPKDHEETSISEIGSPAPPASSQRASPQRESSSIPRLIGASLYNNGSGPAPSTIKLKLNPTAHTAPMRNDAVNPLNRRPSALRGRDDFAALPMTPMQASQAAMWELPKRTPETFIPKPAPLKPIRNYPTRPEDVDVDFAKMDWRERDKERDRLEAAASVNGPGPGQAIIKEGTAASRARDRKQDQVAHHTFQQWSDGWFRTLTEEDLAWVSSKSDELDAFQFPSLGRHYSEVWEEEEANGALIPTVYLPSGAAPLLPTSMSALPSASVFAPNGSVNRPATSVGAASMNGRIVSQPTSLSTISETPKFDPRNLKDDHLYGGSSEDVRSGPFTERLLAALLPTPPSSASSVIDAAAPNSSNGDGHNANQRMQVLTNGHHMSSTSSTSRPQDMAEYEERLRRELKAIDVLGDEDIDWSDRADDEISSTLRTVQRLLRKQIRVNELRKTRLFEIAMDRMAYQEYLGCLNSVEREIEAGWMKRQTQIKKSMQAQKKKKGTSTTLNSARTATALASSDGHNEGSPAVSAGLAAAAAAAASGASGGTAMAASSSSMGANERGGGPIPPQFSDSLLSAMEKRRQLKFAIEPLFVDKPLAKDTPTESVYQDLDFDI